MSKLYEIGFSYDSRGFVIVEEESEARAIALVDNHLCENGIDFDFNETDRAFGANTLTLIENPEGITPTLPFVEEKGTILLHHWSKSNHLDNGIVRHGDILPKSALSHLVAHAVSLGYYFSISPREDDLVFMFDNRRLVVR